MNDKRFEDPHDVRPTHQRARRAAPSMGHPHDHHGDSVDEFGFDSDDWVDHLRAAESRAELGSLGPFELLQEVSRGGQGIVYRARDSRTGTEVALKRLVAGSFATPTMRRRLERELEATAVLDHPGIVHSLGIDHEGGQAVLSMEWIHGQPITTWAAGNGERRAHDDVCRLLLRVCAALQHAHQHGVIHRDLKPNNVLVDAHDQPRILDFGLAKMGADGTDVGLSSLTQTGQFVGTPAYAAPEQISRGPEAVDVRADVYALAVIAYEMLCGQLPYPVGGPIAQTFEAILHHDPKPISSVDRSIARDLEAVLHKALSKDPSARYQSVDAFALDLERYLRGDAVDARRHSRHYEVLNFVRRHRTPVAFASILIVLALGFGATMTVLYRQADEQATKARRIQEFLESTFTPPGPGTHAGDVTLPELLRQATGRVDQEFADHPAVRADLHMRLATIFSQLWMWDDVAPNARAALQIYRSLPGDHRGEIARSATVAAKAAAMLRHLQSVELGREALAIRRDLGDRVGMASAHAALALGLWLAQKPPDNDAARAHYDEALALFEDSNAPPSIEWASAYSAYGALNASLGDLEMATELYTRAVVMHRTLPDAYNIHAVRCIESLGNVLFMQKRFDEAEPLLREAVGRRPPGFVDEQVCLPIWQLGEILEARGEYDAALEQYHRSWHAHFMSLADRAPPHAPRLRRLAARVESEPMTPELVAEMANALEMAEPGFVERFLECTQMIGRCMYASGDVAGRPVLETTFKLEHGVPLDADPVPDGG